jgi:phenylalanyl-tRNA synthetase beta chain
VLEKTVIRGETSEGMLCSEMNWNLGPDGSGLMVLDGGFSAGCFPESGSSAF